MKASNWIVIAAALGLVTFQNCAPVGFDKDYEYLQSSSGTGMIVDDGRDVTNKKIVSVRFTGKTEVFTQMRLSTSPDFDGAEWRAFEEQTLFDFDSAWAPGGEKDGKKQIYAQLRASDVAEPYPLEGAIDLDTLAPTLEPKDLLATGIQGKVFVKGQPVGLRWALADAPASSGYASGLAKDGFSLGLASSADCGERVEWLMAGSAPIDKLDDFRWPAETPLDTFYVCAIAKDRAGNATTLLSQPMTSLWRVYAGDNNQGNGGSVTAPNVRFKFPTSLAVDSKSNLYVADGHFRAIRRIASDDSRTIMTFAGTGRSSGKTEGNALDVAVNPEWEGAFVDSQDRLYYMTANTLFRISTNPMTGDRVTKRLVALCSGASTALRTVEGKESVVIHNACGQTPNDPNVEAFIYEIPMAEIDGATKVITRDELKAKYKIAGNGINPPASFALPSTQILTKNDPADLKFSVGYPGAMIAGPEGEIYFATLADGALRGWGHHSVRKLTFLADGTLRMDLLSKSIAWSAQMALMPAGTASSSALLVGTASGLKKLELSPKADGSYAVSNAIASANGEQVYGIVRAGNDYYASVSTQSRLVRLDSRLSVIETLGRAVYREEEPVATLAMIGQPEGLVQDPRGNTYFFDSINHVVRQVTPGGAVVRVAGTPGKPVHQFKKATKLEDVKFDGLSVFNGSYLYNMTGSFSADGSVNKIFVGEGSMGRLTEIDLNSGLAETIAGANTQNRMNDPLFWPIGAIAKAPDSDQLYVTRYCPVATCGTTGHGFAGLLTKVDGSATRAPASQVAGDLTVDAPAFYQTTSNSLSTGTPADKALYYASPSSRVDSAGHLFTSYQGFFIQKIVNGQPQAIVNVKVNDSKRFNMGVFEVLEDGDDRLFFYRSGEGLSVVRVNLAQAMGANPPSFTSQKLCLPGTYVNEPRAFTLTRDGNLLVADSRNGRLLEYFLRDQDGRVKLSTCP